MDTDDSPPPLAEAEYYAHGIRKSYKGPTLAETLASMPVLDEPPPTRLPVYLGPDGTLYDLHYNVCSNPSREAHDTDTPEDERLRDLAYDVTKEELFRALPCAENFENYNLFEEALFRWAEACEKALGFLQLPELVGRCYNRPSMNSDLTLQNCSFDHDPWHAVLYPPTPDPAYYTSQAEFEYALSRWAVVCAQSVPVLPPHPSQLANLLNLKIVPQDSHVAASRLVAVGLETVPTPSNRRLSVLQGDWKVDNLWATLGPEVREAFNAAYNHLVDNSVRGPPAFDPTIHGTLPRPVIGMSRRRRTTGPGPTANTPPTQNVAEFVGLQRYFDCALSADVRVVDVAHSDRRVQIKVGFFLPTYDLHAERFDLLQLQRDLAYLQQMRYKIQQIDFDQRLNHLFSWNYPNLHPIPFDPIQLELLAQVQSGALMTMQQLMQLLQSNMFADRFEELLVILKPLVLSSNIVTPRAFRDDLLPLYLDSNNSLVHAKLASFVMEILSTPLASPLLSVLFESKDIVKIHTLLKLLNFYGTLPVDILAFDMDMQHLIALGSGHAAYSLMSLQFLKYYLDLLLFEFTSTQMERNVLHMSCYDVIAAHHGRTQAEIVRALTSETGRGWLGRTAFPGMAHRNKGISGLFLFSVVRLIHDPDPAIRTWLHASDLLTHLRGLGWHTRTHVKFATRRLFDLLQEGDWGTFLWRSFTPEILEADITQFENTANKRLPLLAQLEKDLIGNMLLRATPAALDHVLPLVNSNIFQRLVRSCSEEVKRLKYNIKASALPRSDQGQGLATMSLPEMVEFVVRPDTRLAQRAELFTSLLAMLMRHFSRLDLVTYSTNFKNLTMSRVDKKKIPEQPAVRCCVVLQNILDLCKFLEEASEVQDPNYEVKNNTLTAIRFLLKNSTINSEFQKESRRYERFIIQLMDFCRDGKDFNFNRNAWRTFFQLIRFHPKGMRALEKMNKLNMFFEVIGTEMNKPTGRVVIVNSLLYLARIFTLVTVEADRERQGRRVASKEARKYHKATVDLFIKFLIKKQFFIRFHMIYRRFIEDPLKGAHFQRLAYMYNLIFTAPQCYKFLKDVWKNVEYQEELIKINQCFLRPEVLDPIKERLAKKGRKWFGL